MTVNYSTYRKDFITFTDKHRGNGAYILDIHTSPMVNGGYHKEWAWSDGAVWYEDYKVVNEEVEFEVHGVKAKTEVMLHRTEYWSTESPSKYYYEAE